MAKFRIKALVDGKEKVVDVHGVSDQNHALSHFFHNLVTSGKSDADITKLTVKEIK